MTKRESYDVSEGSVHHDINLPNVGLENKGFRKNETVDGDARHKNGDNLRVTLSNASPADAQDEKEEEVVATVTLNDLFQFATTLDWIFMFIATIASIINGVVQPVSFILLGEIINKFIDFQAGKDVNIEDEMADFALYYVVAAGVTIVCGYIANTLWLYASLRQSFVIRTKCFHAIMRQDIGWFDTTDSGELSTRLSDDITKIQNGIGDKVGALTQSLSMLVAGIVIGFAYSWELTLVIVAMTPVLVIAAFISGKVIGMITSRELTAYAKAGAVAEEALSAIRTVIAFSGEQKEVKRYKSLLQDAEKAGILKGISSGFGFGIFNAVIFSSCGLAFWFGGLLVADGELNGGDLLIVFFSILIGAAQFGQTGPNIEAIMIARGAAFYIYSLIEREPLINSFSDAGTTPKVDGDVKFVDCQFSYPSRPDVQILQGLNLEIPKGMTCALVGESGCGKSTTIKLIQRFYDVKEGKVLIDGNDIKNINVRYFRKHIGIVSQEPVLFDTTIAENIKMGNDNATQEMIETAAKNANAYDFITNLPKGFDTYVGESGAQLSGGQKQRIAIARALVRDPKILLLDEATSALDTESEAVVQSALEKASEGRTTIIIAHRLSTVRKADTIAVVAQGRIVEIGNHDDLMTKRGEYFKLVMLQTFEEAEEKVGDGNNEIISLLSNAEKEEIIVRKMLRSISNMSSNSEEEENIRKNLATQISRRISMKNRKKEELFKRQNSKMDEEIVEEPVNIPSFTRIIALNASEWPYMTIGSIFAALAGLFPVVFSIILAEVLESFTEKGQPDKIRQDSGFWSIMFMVLGCSIGVSYFIAQYMFAVSGEKLTTRLREMAFNALLRQEIGYFDEPAHSTGALTSRLAADASAVQGATSTRLNTLIQVIVMGGSALIISFVFSWQLSLVVLAFVPFIAFAGAVQTKLNKSFAVDNQKYLEDAGSVATEAIMQIRTVASLGKEEHFYNKYYQLLLGPNKKSQRGAHFFGLSFGFSMGIIFFSNAASFRMGGYLAAEHGLSLADMMKVIMSLQFGSMTAGQLASFAPDYVKAKVAAGRILNLFDRVPAIDGYSNEGLKTEIEGNVQFSNVKFSYPNRPDVPVLQGLSVKIHKGQTMALVGASGCGKSTSVSLLERFYDVTGGDIKIDGKSIKEYNIRHLRSQIGIVQQEPLLFDCSIRDNILYGVDDEQKSKITQQEIEVACKNANIHSFIISLAKGYNTNVGEKGGLISGGQKQRIAIARALIRNPKILLLDEATSALDSESERIVQDALDVAMDGRTAIVIAHRLSTIQNADTIAVVQGGKIVEMGNHHELLAWKGAYYVLNQAQF